MAGSLLVVAGTEWRRRDERSTAQLTDADGQLDRSPSPVGLTVAVGPSDQIESGRAVIHYPTTEGVTLAFVPPVGYVRRLAARSCCKRKM